MTGVLTWLGVALLGGAGAVLRVLVDERVRGLVGPNRAFPTGILVVNLSGAFAAGVLAGATLGETQALLAATAFVGAYSTFSTWMLDVAEAASARLVAVAASNLVGSLVLGGLAAAAGLAVGHAS